MDATLPPVASAGADAAPVAAVTGAGEATEATATAGAAAAAAEEAEEANAEAFFERRDEAPRLPGQRYEVFVRNLPFEGVRPEDLSALFSSKGFPPTFIEFLRFRKQQGGGGRGRGPARPPGSFSGAAIARFEERAERLALLAAQGGVWLGGRKLIISENPPRQGACTPPLPSLGQSFTSCSDILEFVLEREPGSGSIQFSAYGYIAPTRRLACVSSMT